MKSRFDQAFYVYILTGGSGVLYTGIANDLTRRISGNKQKQITGFTKRFNLTRLVWYIHAPNDRGIPRPPIKAVGANNAPKAGSE